MIFDIGVHRVKHGNIMDGIDDLMQGEKADIVFVDTPWGKGNLNYWQTMNTRMNGVSKAQIEYNQFINQVFKLGWEYSKEVFILEYGQRWRDEIIQMGKDYGFVYHRVATAHYRGGKDLLPLDVHYFGKTDLALSDEFLKSLYDTHGYKSEKAMASPFVAEGKVLLDFCCGLGYMARLCKEHGMIFRGCEINAKRLEKTKSRLK